MRLTKPAGIVFCFLLFTGCSKTHDLSALGTIERDRVVLKATAAEIIVEQPVKEGSYIKAGTLLVKLDSRRQQARVAKAQAEAAKASAVWEQLRNGARVEDIDAAKAKVDGAEASLTVAKKNYLRVKELTQKQISTQADLDSVVAQRDSAQASLQAARKHLLVLTNGTRKEQLDQAEAAYNAAVAQLELEQIQLQELNVVATRDGLLDSLPWNTGERVSAGAPVAIVLAGDSPYARVYVPEEARAQLQVGQLFDVEIDGLDQSLTGQLRWISSDPAFTPYYALNERDRSRLVYLAEFDLPEGASVPSGIPVEVNLSSAKMSAGK